MGRISLPPGFRFHPTDVELVMYYLKRKVMGKKLHFEAITEVNIYKFSPWELPDKSCLKSKDLEWFFFCPREKRYASGDRVKRSTENGYWKTTGKDRPVFYNNNIVGMVKTLIFHLGHAPKGQRTDWVIHEFKILDKQLAEAGIQDSYVLCKVFEKNGPGPKNGAQYGAPFNEAEWDNDDETLICSGSLPSDDPSVTASTLPENRNSSVKTSMVVPGSTLASSLIEAGPSSVRPSDDDIVHLLAPSIDHSMLNFSKKRNRKYHDNEEENNTSLPGTSENDIYNGLPDLYNWDLMTEGEFDTSGMQEDGHLMNQMPLQNDVAYIELNDLIAPLDFCPKVNATEEISIGNLFVPSCPGNMEVMTEGEFDTTGMQEDGHLMNQMPLQNDVAYIELNDLIAPMDFCPDVNATEEISIGNLFVPYCPGNMDYVGFRGDFSGINPYASGLSQHPVLPEGSNRQEGCLDVLQTVNSDEVTVNLGNNSAQVLDFTFTQPTEDGHFTKSLKRGRFDDI